MDVVDSKVFLMVCAILKFIKRKFYKRNGFIIFISKLLPPSLKVFIESNIPDFDIIFDEKFYHSNLDSSTNISSPNEIKKHYILIGAKKGYNPNLYFDAEFYKRQANLDSNFPLSPLAHFLLIGRHKRISPHPEFDFFAYEKERPDLRIQDRCLYIQFLHDKKRDSTSFCTDSSVKLTHDENSILRKLQSNTEFHWPEKPLIDVVMPVYGGGELVWRALNSVLSSRNRTPFRLVVVDDASPDPEFRAILRQLAQQIGFDLIVNDTNKGFVYSANVGINFSDNTDVVLLNSDTEVYGDWLDRLRAAAYATPNTATVTPLTNNGTICSYPYPNKNNPLPTDITPAALDALAARVNAGVTVDIPTGVGFCMYVTRRALNALGAFDERAFGKGYGEENDFCRRAAEKGFVNVAAPNVFVRHEGGASFGEERETRIRNALKILSERYPDYSRLVSDFIKRDPLAPYRARLDEARLHEYARDKNVLIISHARKGGTEEAVELDARQRLKRGEGVFVLLPAVPGRSGLFQLLHHEQRDLPNLPAFALHEESDRDRLAALMRRIGIDEVVVHHTIDLGPAGPDVIRDLCRRAQVPYGFFIHDYLALCPRISLTHRDGSYCHERGPQHCRLCLLRNGSEFGRPNIVEWRRRWRAFLDEAAWITAPSLDAVRRFRRHFPGLRITCRPFLPPASGEVASPSASPESEERETIDLAVIGSIGRKKGFGVILSLAKYARENRIPLRITLVGKSRDDEALRKAGVHVTGPYLNSELLQRLDEIDPDCVFIPSIWPETYSFTLSHALRSGRPVVAFDIGAMSERLRDLPHALLLPLSWSRDPRRMVRALFEWLPSLRQKGKEETPLKFAESRPWLNLDDFYEILETEPPAEKTYVIFFTPRSASSHLSRLLASTGCLGRPEEWFNPDWMNEVMHQLGAPDLPGYIDGLRRRHKSENGVFGARVTFAHMEKTGDPARFLRSFPRNTAHVLLLSRNIVLQGISLYKAMKTGVFHKTGEKAADSSSSAPPYDGAEILGWIRHIHNQERGLYDLVVHERVMNPRQMFFYEDLIGREETMIRDIARLLDVDITGKDCATPASPHAKLGDDDDLAFEQRFRAENEAYLSRLERKRRRMFERLARCVR